MLWSQSEAEYARCVETIAHAGSTVRDTLGWWVDLYLDHDGDQVQVWGAAFAAAQRPGDASSPAVDQASERRTASDDGPAGSRGGEQLALAS